MKQGDDEGCALDGESGAIDVRVITQYIPEKSNPDQDEYVFAYTITITNEGNESAQLISRYWRITDANDEVLEVRGEGVVGQQPLLEPGESYRYTSGTVLKTAVGYMQGSYQMRSHTGREFDADVPAFSLSLPTALH